LETLAKAQNEFLNRQFEDLLRTKRILEASVIPLGLLAIGIAFEIFRLPRLWVVLAISAFGVLLLAILSPFFTIRIGQSLDRLEIIAPKIATAKQVAS
jgi:hypothetical protein